MKVLYHSVLAAMLAGFSTTAARVAASPAAEASADSCDIRIYFLDRATPARSLKGAVASFLVERESGEAATYLLPLVEQTSPDSRWEPGMIRGLVGTPYFVELVVEDGKAKPGKESPSRGLAPGKPGHPAPGQLLTSEEVLRRAHRGPCFLQKIPAHLLSGPYRATLTVRLENETVSSEEFQSPSSPPKDAAAGALSAVEALWNRVEGGAKFMELKPLAQDLMKDLAMLAPTGFMDDGGSFEKDRQWCLSLGRAIEKGCDEGATGLVQNMSGQCKSRLREMQEFLESLSCPGTSPEGCTPAESP